MVIKVCQVRLGRPAESANFLPIGFMYRPALNLAIVSFRIQMIAEIATPKSKVFAKLSFKNNTKTSEIFLAILSESESPAAIAVTDLSSIY